MRQQIGGVLNPISSTAPRRFAALLGALAVVAAGLTWIAQPASAANTYATAQIDCNVTAAGNIAASGVLVSTDILNVNYINCNGYTLSTVAGAFTSASVTLPFTDNGNNAATRTLTGYNGTATPLATLAKAGEKTFTIVQGSATPNVDKVTICHRTRATTNPYVLITVSVSSVVSTSDAMNGHADHNTTRTNKVNPTTNGITPGSGPFDSSFNYPANRKWWGDIIPPFAYSGGSYAGLNWPWNAPTSTWQSGSGQYWITDANFADAINGSSSFSPYNAAVAACIDLTSKSASTQSQAVDTPAKYYKVNVDNGADPDEVKQDLREQSVSETDITSAQTSYAASVVTDNPTNVSQTSGTINGTLNTPSGGANWSSSYFNYYTGSNTPTSTPSVSAGGATTSVSRSVDLPGLTCGTTYYYQIVGITASPTATYYGGWKSFTTAACSGGGGSNPTPTPTPTPSATPSATPSPSTLNRPPAALPSLPPASPTPSATPTRENAQPPVTLDPTNIVPLPPGEQVDPEKTRVIDPETGKPTTEVKDDQGTWKVNEPSGTITFQPAPNFIGTATLNVQLSGRSGRLYIAPMTVRIGAKSRIAVITGDVPGSISAGVAFTGDAMTAAEYFNAKRR